MPLTIQNRGVRAAVIQLDATVVKVRQTVRTSKRDPKTGKKTIISKRRVIGGSMTILAGDVVSKLPNGKPIPASVGRLEQVRKNAALVVSEISDGDWDSEHRKRSAAAPKSRRRRAAAAPTED